MLPRYELPLESAKKLHIQILASTSILKLSNLNENYYCMRSTKNEIIRVIRE